MNIGLIFPNHDRRYKTIHLGLGYIAAYARMHHPDLNFKVLDTRVATKKETDRFFKTPFDLIGITVFSPLYYEVIDILKRIKQNNNKTPVCIGGPYVTTLMEDIFKYITCEYAVYGEGEVTFSELIYHLKGQFNIKDIKGLMYRTESGAYIKNSPREQNKNIDNFPSPAYDLFPMDRYPVHRISTGRGCAYSCAFCNSSSVWMGKWRKRSAKKLIEEIDFLIKNYGKKIFIINDDTFNIDIGSVNEFCDLLIEKKTNILWAAQLRAENITQPVADKMSLAGCYNVCVGVESANNTILSKINKKASIEEITEGIRILKKAGLEVLGHFVIGSPGETLETVKESFNYAKRSELDYVNFYTVLPIKNTPQWDYVLKCGHLYSDKIHDFYKVNPRIVFDTPEFSYDDRLEAIKIATKEGFYKNSDERSWWLDVGKEFTKRMQNLLPAAISSRLFRFMKTIYRILLRR
jgi:radical SAM superfamily enzyme YgiQ (UPF0313 family)